MDSNSCNQHPFSVARRVKSTTRSLSGVFAFRGEGVAFESGLERDFLSRMDFRRDVMSAVAQPIQLNFVARNGRSYTYTPDFLVRFHSHTRQSPMLVEVNLRRTGVSRGAIRFRSGRQRCVMPSSKDGVFISTMSRGSEDSL